MDNERYNSGLKNLHRLIQQASAKYANEFVWQDVRLTKEFKDAYTKVLQSNGYDIEFFECSAVITTSQGRYIFVPNQWFVIASYPLEVFMELMYYKEQVKGIADFIGKQFTPYAKQLRDQPTSVDKDLFCKEKSCRRKFRMPKTGFGDLHLTIPGGPDKRLLIGQISICLWF